MDWQRSTSLLVDWKVPSVYRIINNGVLLEINARECDTRKSLARLFSRKDFSLGVFSVLAHFSKVLHVMRLLFFLLVLVKK
ncbi:hypothetical protein NDU88_004847 [Pleurodeles waltl]|uniref:Uncharacterized protein n=1 Tax=Pleurodeles waltl TaxID=8319 RepID=A0AAV7WT29_PLEWA|nr:hypothetical protein NDU88_004847 [Pleurodeles waltl]